MNILALLSLTWCALSTNTVTVWRGEALDKWYPVAETASASWPVDPAASPTAFYKVVGDVTDISLTEQLPSSPEPDSLTLWNPDARIPYPYDAHYAREDYQWALKNTGQPSKLYYDGVLQSQEAGTFDAGIADAWAVSPKVARGIRIGVIDLGCNQHEDLEGAVIAGRDFIYGGAKPYDYSDADAQFHGTMMATIIAARKDNGKGIAGVAHNASLLIARASGLNRGDAVPSTRAVQWLTEMKADVIYFGSGARNNDAALSNACHGAVSAGIPIVCSVLNSYTDMDNPATPTDYPTSWRMPGVLSVTASTRDGKVFGAAAYGTNILALPGRSIIAGMGTDGYGYYSGTSPAGAIATGMLAVLKAQFPSDTPQQLIERLMSTAVPAAKVAGLGNLKNAIGTAANAPAQLSLIEAFSAAPKSTLMLRLTFEEFRLLLMPKMLAAKADALR